MSAATSPAPRPSLAARAPLLVVLCGCMIAMLTFGPRASSGIFLLPMTGEYGWGRDTFGLAIAIQNLLWGVGTPFAGAIADRFGVVRVLWAGAVLYALGLVLMAFSATPGMLHLSAGVMIGFGLSGCSFNIVLAAFGKMLPEKWRPISFGAGTAAGSFGQFLFPPLAAGLNTTIGWHQTLIVFGAAMLLVMPFALALATPKPTVKAHEPQQSIGGALGEAFRHPSYIYLVLGFFTCGFQLAFVTTHLPAYLTDRGLSLTIGGWTLAVIGLANMVGSLSSGWLSSRMSRRYLLSAIYFGRGIAIAAFVLLPASPVTSIGFGIVLGLLWLSTVPPTSGLVMLMFGTRYLAMLYGFAFFSHQVGGFLGVWLGGVLYEQLGSYDFVWWLAVALSFASAAINLPIVERPVERGEPARA
ncbi:major facilitator superfamily MFS_1 [Ancylobacter novellus DSM 506]|uniref:Major facilitator superfamily MFS_1 n=1 Tax=Ancylobacter novellus (strain ATCC 8093 / DSM 506 / JCM 20403 / CCM 1077 / IAM 12100 / NBRC 12443 / NCIMB 10456) TaxID=639283 RepID=D6ZZM3_ANCN5|nr:MFS transporter [Ancylobacter novellus]ADH91218.1 major facilitator superfamily MFS_1 [Ancylobacter novellus DSM 506]